MNQDDPISQLVRMYKESLLLARIYQQLAGVSRSKGVSLPEIEVAESRIRPQLDREFRVYEQALRDGDSPKDALQKLIDSFPAGKD